ncbi:MAG: DUF3267 domain-containing protein [Lachnospiraceae bacterium]|nr:DUF3267 domain-containing protein [Lachnospiraceae bacterium]
MFYFMKPLPESTMDFTGWQPFIKNDWFRKNFMLFVYALQAALVAASVLLGVWEFTNWFVKIAVFCIVYVCHELLHIVVVWRIGDLSLTHSGIFFWLNSDAVMSKARFWTFMTLPFLGLTAVPAVLLLFVDGFLFELLLYIAWINAIIAGSDIINSVLILLKPNRAKFYRGFYKTEK